MNYKTLTAVYKENCLDKPGVPDFSKCVTYNNDVIKETLQKIDEFLVNDFSDELLQKNYGFGNYDKSLRQKLISLREPLQHFYNLSIRGYNPEFSEVSLNNIISHVNQIIGLNYTLKYEAVDQSLPESFSSNCVPYEAWERALYVKAPNLKINAEPVQKCMGFTYDLTVKQDKEKACKFLFNLSAKIEDICNYDYKLEVNPKTCQQEYDMLIRKIPNCKYTYKEYAKFREDGFTRDLIEELLDLGIETERDPETGDFVFTTSEGNTYTSSSLLSIEEITNNI